MNLEMHDSESESLTARVRGIDFDYQAEQEVQDFATDPCTYDPRPERWIVRWILRNDDGSERAVWERLSGDRSCPKLVRISPQFSGEWRVGI